MKKKGRIIILSGPSGAGKTTLSQKLLKDKNFRGLIVRSVSLTTRPPRAGERDGRDYFFVSPKNFLYKKRAGHLLESQKVYRDYYGTPLKPVRDLLERGKHVLLCIEVKGALVVRAKAPQCLMIFVKPPSREALKKRLVGRGTEDPAVVDARLRRADEELREMKKYDYVVVNDDLTACYKQLKRILQKKLFAPSFQ